MDSASPDGPEGRPPGRALKGCMLRMQNRGSTQEMRGGEDGGLEAVLGGVAPAGQEKALELTPDRLDGVEVGAVGGLSRR